MSEKPPTSYSELAEILTALPLLLQETCRQRRITQQTAAKQMGLSASTVSRVVNGVGEISLDGAIAVLRWFDTGGAA